MLEEFKIKIIYSIFALLFCISTVSAQFNVKIGYELEYFRSEANRQLTEKFNDQYGDIVGDGQEMKTLGFMNGLVMGLSYKTKFSRIELSYHTLQRTRDAYGQVPATDSTSTSPFETSLRYRLRGFQLGYEFLVGRFSAGATIGNDYFMAVSQINGSSNDLTITRQQNLSTALHISYALYQSDNISLVLRPYYKLYFDDINHNPIKEFLDVQGIDDLSGKPYSVGVSIIFFNGPQGNN